MKANSVLLIGYVGQDLVSQQFEKIGKRVSIRMATHYKHVNEKGEKIDHTVWHDVVAWRKTAEYAERSFVKGSKILVEGCINYQVFTGKEGKQIKLTLIHANSLVNLDR